MKNNSLIHKLYMYIGSKYPEFVNGGEVERLGMELGYKASTASRRARDLEEAGSIERRIRNGSVEYRYISKAKIEAFAPKVEPPKDNQLNIFADAK